MSTDAAPPPKPTKTEAELRFDESRRKVGIVAGPLLFLLVWAWPFTSLTPEGHRLAAVMALVIVFWITEALPLAVTALLGPTLAVVLQVAPAGLTFRPFASTTIFLFIGSFILAQALFVHRVNERIAYGVLSLRVIGAHPTPIGRQARIDPSALFHALEYLNLSCDNYDVLARVTAETDAVWISSPLSARRELAAGKLTLLDHHSLEIPDSLELAVVTIRDAILSPATRLVIDDVVETVRQLTKDYA